MAELIIKNFDSTSSHPASSKRGDVIAVMDDGHIWGNKECLPDFLVIHIDGSVADLQYLTEPITDSSGQMITKRKYKFDIDANTPKSRLDQIKNSDWLVDNHDISKIIDKTK